MMRWIDVTPSLVFDTSWTVWALSWIAAAVWSSADVEWRPMRRDWLPYGLIIASILIPVTWHALGWRAVRWWDVGRDGAYGLAAATIAGFLFAWWARLHLGALWSAAITCKRDHKVVDTGPYALVRHPIYAGILWSALMTDIAAATAPACISFAALAVGFLLKAGAEERFLRAQLGAESFETYTRRVPMLIPSKRVR